MKIRLSRAGAKKRPFYRIVVTDSRNPRDGRYIERLGTYDPMLPKDKQRVTLVEDRIRHWLGVGANPQVKLPVRWRPKVAFLMLVHSPLFFRAITNL